MTQYIPISLLTFLRQDLEKTAELNRNWYVNRILRFMIWLIFVVACIGFVYLPNRNLQQSTDEYATRSITAANQGLPFFFTYPKSPWFITFNQLPYREVGVYILNAIAYVVGRTVLGNTFQLPPNTSFYLVLGLMIITSLLFLSPTVPFLISLGGNVALLGAILTRTINLWEPSSRWGATYGAILLFMMLALSFTVGTKRQHNIYAHILLLGILAGITKYLREESTILVYGALLLIISIIVILEIINYAAKGQGTWRLLIRQSALLQPLAYCLLFVVIVYSSQFFVRGLYALAWKVPFSETNDSFHGSGHPLLLGLGYVDNPYNIGWADNLGPVQTELRFPSSVNLSRFDNILTVYNQYYESDYQTKAGKLAQTIILQNPSLLLKNTITKAKDSIKWFLGGDANYPVRTSFGSLYIAFSLLVFILGAFSVGLLLITAWYIQSIQAWILGLTSLGLIALSLISPLLIHPFYVSALRGVLYSFAFILLGVCFTLWLRQNPSQPNQLRSILLRCTVGICGLSICGLVIIGGIFVILNNRYQQHLQTFLTPDPASELASMTYQYADAFNGFDRPTQEQILSKLQQASDIQNFSVISDKSDQESLLNTPQIFVQGHYIYVVAMLGVNSQLPYNGSRLHMEVNTSNILRVSLKCGLSDKCITPTPCNESITICGTDTQINIDSSVIQQWLINDRSWNTGLFRMFVMPIDPTELTDDVTSLTVGLYNNVRETRIGEPAEPKTFYVLDRQKSS